MMIGAVTSRGLCAEAGGAQVSREVILLELGDQSDDAAVVGHEVPFVAEAPQIPVQICGDRNRDREGRAAE